MIMKFSERKGLVPVSRIIQVEGMSDELRSSIWNVLDTRIWSEAGFKDWYRNQEEPRIREFSKILWLYYFKRPIDTRPENDDQILKKVRAYFFDAPWNEVYDFVEFICRMYKKPPDWLIEDLNNVLERELSAYRIVDRSVVDVTDKQEIEMLEAALKDTKYDGVNRHLKRALELLSDRKSPDFRNSIKESISAVESIARSIVGRDKATLGEALVELEKRKKLHPALKQGFSTLYGYTSDEDGIRHAMLEEPNLTAADAKYFLLSCTSFVNYLKSQG